MRRNRIILSLDTIAVAVVLLIFFVASARSDYATTPNEERAEYVDLR